MNITLTLEFANGNWVLISKKQSWKKKITVNLFELVKKMGVNWCFLIHKSFYVYLFHINVHRQNTEINQNVIDSKTDKIEFFLYMYVHFFSLKNASVLTNKKNWESISFLACKIRGLSLQKDFCTLLRKHSKIKDFLD